MLEHEFDGIHGRLARDEDHCMHGGEENLSSDKNDHPLRWGHARRTAWRVGLAVCCVISLDFIRTKAVRSDTLTEYLLFTRPLDRCKLLRKLFLQILHHCTIVWIVTAVVITGSGIGDSRRLWPELGGKLEGDWS
jgi:hypothetical protein